METINNIELRDEHIYPDEEVLSAVLGESFPIYKELIDLYDRNALIYEWRYYNDGKAWLCKVQQKKKTIVWMSVWKDYMQAAIYFPERLIDQVLELDISDAIKEKIVNTKKVGKTRPCIFELRDEKILTDFEKVMHYKLVCK